MKKTEDYIKPVILDAIEVSQDEIEEIRSVYINDRDLDKKLAKLSRK